MPKSLYSPDQKILSDKGKENWDKINWNSDDLGFESYIRKPKIFRIVSKPVFFPVIKKVIKEK